MYLVGKRRRGAPEEEPEVRGPDRTLQVGKLAFSFLVNVDCRGFPAQSVEKLFQDLGILTAFRAIVQQQQLEAAEKLSGWVCHKREKSNWMGCERVVVDHYC